MALCQAARLINRAMVRVRWVERLRAWRLGRYLRSAAVRRIFSATAGLTRQFPLRRPVIATDAVATDTPAAAATSANVTRLLRLLANCVAMPSDPVPVMIVSPTILSRCGESANICTLAHANLFHM